MRYCFAEDTDVRSKACVAKVSIPGTACVRVDPRDTPPREREAPAPLSTELPPFLADQPKVGHPGVTGQPIPNAEVLKNVT